MREPIIGREKERELLNKIKQSKEAEFVTLY